MTQICTSIEQSKKLLELGLSGNTSDMCWSLANPDLPTLLAFPIADADNRNNDKIPAWSLSALLELMPDEIKYEDENCSLEIAKDWVSYEGCDRYDASYRIQPFAFNNKPLLELLFKAVCWLLENNYIKTEKA